MKMKKTFSELTVEQQEQAIEEAKNLMLESVNAGIIGFNKFMTVEELDRLASEAAWCGYYNVDGKPLTEENDIPSFYLGGCI